MGPRRWIAGLAALVGLAMSGLAHAQPPSWRPDDDQIARIEALRVEHRVPGMAIAVLEGGELAWTGNFGERDIEAGEPVADDTLFQAASLTKPVFAYVVMQLVEEGKLELDAPLARYYVPPDFPETEAILRITVRHVLTHSSGLPNWRGSEDDSASGMVPAFEPGSQNQYSGEAFVWLQKAVETVTGESLQRVMSHYLFRNANIDGSLVVVPEDELRYAAGYSLDDDGRPERAPDLGLVYLPHFHDLAQDWQRPVENWRAADFADAIRIVYPLNHPRYGDFSLHRLLQPNYLPANVAGGLRLTVADYARFMALLMPQPHRDSWQISEAARTLMLSPQIARWHESLPGGLGIGVERSPAGDFFYHSGNNGGVHHSFMLGHPATGRGIVIMTNGANGADLYKAVLALLVDEELISIT